MTDPVTDFAGMIIRQLIKEVAEIMQPMSEGHCIDQESYKFSCGQIRAYRMAQQIVEETAKRLTGAEREK